MKRKSGRTETIPMFADDEIVKQTPREHFFSGCKCPVNVSNVIVALAVGTVIQVEKLADELVPAMVLLATIARQHYNMEIVDFYQELLDRQKMLFDSFVGHKVFWHPELMVVSSICIGWEPQLDELRETGYMFQVFEEMINAEPEKLFQ